METDNNTSSMHGAALPHGEANIHSFGQQKPHSALHSLTQAAAVHRTAPASPGDSICVVALQMHGAECNINNQNFTQTP